MALRSGVTLAVLAVGCGGSTLSPDGGAAGTNGAAGAGGAPCATGFAACGGDVVGTWKTDERCSPPGKVGGNTSSCAGEVFDFTQVRSRIGWTFRADHTMTLTLTASGPATMVFPDTCLAAATPPVACTGDGIRGAFGVTFPGGTATLPTCTDANGTCSCTLSIEAAPLNETGTYQASGSMLTIAVMDNPTLVFDYCATATTLSLREHGTGGSLGDVLPFDKQ